MKPTKTDIAVATARFLEIALFSVKQAKSRKKNATAFTPGMFEATEQWLVYTKQQIALDLKALEQQPKEETPPND